MIVMNALTKFSNVIYEFIYNNTAVQLILLVSMVLLGIDSVRKVIYLIKLEKEEEEEMRRFEEMRKRNENISFQAHDNIKDR